MAAKVRILVFDGTDEGFSAGEKDLAYQKDFDKLPWVGLPNDGQLFWAGGNPFKAEVHFMADGLVEIHGKASETDQSSVWHKDMMGEGYELAEL